MHTPHTNRTSVLVLIEDEGIGIPTKEFVRLAEPFFRGSNIGEVPSSGLGMTIIERILQPMGGVASRKRSW
jgi:signal transduction histidine kinase